MPIDPGAFDLLTFDCYGTLVDWESGILAAVRPVLAAHGVSREDEAILALHAELEPEAEKPPYRSYREVLARVVEGMGRKLGFEPSESERGSLAASIAGWPPFPDTVESLRRLEARYALGVISNVDDDLFEATARGLGIRFDGVVTAMQAGAYKPDLRVFRTALDAFGVPRERILHVAQSLFHDVAPARSLGVATVWVNRRAGRTGPGATPPSTAVPDLEVGDLASLARILGEG